jgi:uncharacterized protein (DUF1330 family)
MKTRYTVALSMIAGAALGGAAIQGLHAQASAQPGYLPAVRKAIENAHGRSLRTLNGRVVSIEGGAPPKNVAIIEWDNLDDAVAFYSRKPGRILRPSVTNRKRRYGGT